MTQLYSILCNCLLFSFNSFLLGQILMIPCFRSGVFDVPWILSVLHVVSCPSGTSSQLVAASRLLGSPPFAWAPFTPWLKHVPCEFPLPKPHKTSGTLLQCAVGAQTHLVDRYLSALMVLFRSKLWKIVQGSRLLYNIPIVVGAPYPNFWVLNPMVIAIKIAPSPGISQSSNRIIPSISNIPRKHPHQKPPCLLVTVTTIYCSHLFKPQANHVGRLSHCRCTLNSHWHSIRRPRRSRSRKGSQGVWIRSESGVRGGSSYLES